MVAFYNQGDQNIYKDFQYVPQEKYRLGFTAPTTSTTEPVSGGITNTNAFTNSGDNQNNYYAGTTGSLVSGFNQAITDRQNRLEELNRPLAEAQFPSFPGPKTPGGFDAQEMYNKASADLNDPFNRLATTQTFSGQMRPAKEVMDYADNIIDDYRMQYATGQLGPSYIPAEKPTLGRKISDAFYSLPGLSKPQSARDIMESGYTGTGSGPGLMAAILGKFDKYSGLPRADQAFIASRMGYTGPTIFGANDSGLSKDPFGINTRSAFGNYAEYTTKRADELNKSLQKSKDRWTDKFGSLDEIDPRYGKTWSQMNKNNLDMQSFYNQGAEELEKTKEEDYQNRIDKFVKNYNRPGVKKMFKEAYDGTNIHGGDNTTGGTTATGGGAEFTGSGNFSNIDNSGKNYGPYSGGGNGGGGNPTGSPGSKGPGGSDEMGSFARGGRARYVKGGLVSIL